MTHDSIVPAIVRAARRAPTPAALASVQAALTGRPTPAALDAPRAASLLRRDALDPLSLAVPPAPPAPDYHAQGQPDPSLNWMFRPRP